MTRSRVSLVWPLCQNQMSYVYLRVNLFVHCPTSMRGAHCWALTKKLAVLSVPSDWHDKTIQIRASYLPLPTAILDLLVQDPHHVKREITIWRWNPSKLIWFRHPDAKLTVEPRESAKGTLHPNRKGSNLQMFFWFKVWIRKRGFVAVVLFHYIMWAIWVTRASKLLGSPLAYWEHEKNEGSFAYGSLLCWIWLKMDNILGTK